MALLGIFQTSLDLLPDDFKKDFFILVERFLTQTLINSLIADLYDRSTER